MKNPKEKSIYENALARIEEKISYRKKEYENAKKPADKADKKAEEKLKDINEEGKDWREITMEKRAIQAKTHGAHGRLNSAKLELDTLIEQRDELLKKGEEGYNHIVESTVNEIIDELDGRKANEKRLIPPSSRGGAGAHKELQAKELMPLAEVVDEEERLKNTPAEGIYRDKKRVEENVESDRGTEQDIYDAIDEKLIKKAKILTPKSKYQGTVKEIDQRGNARLTFFNEKTYGTLRAREVKAYEKAHKRAMKEGDKVFVRYQGPNEKGKFMFTLLRDQKTKITKNKHIKETQKLGMAV